MRLYRLLLRLYPASFRAEYESELCALFERRRREEHSITVWIGAIADVVTNAVGVHWDLLRQDLRWTFVSLRKAPGFAAIAIVVAAAGLGATTAAFTLLNHVLIRPLPFPEPEQLVMLYQTELPRGAARAEVTPPNYEDWRALNGTFSAMGAYVPAAMSANLSGLGEPIRLGGIMVNAELFRTLGVVPAVGRTFTPEDERAGGPAAVVLSDGSARRLFGSPVAALGRSVRLNQQPFTIVGVMPPHFRFPYRDVDVWLPLGAFVSGLAWEDRRNHLLNVLGRLRPGTSIEQARADLGVIVEQLERAYPAENADVAAVILSLRDVMSPESRTLIVAVFGAAFCLTMIACTNLANLLFARALARRQELAVRLALGAGRERLVRQLLTETFVLALTGSLLGLAIAIAARPLLLILVPPTLPIAAMPEIDWRVFAFAACLAAATTFLFGVGPAMRATRGAAFASLRVRGGAGRDRMRTALVLAELAATVVLLVATGLLLKAMWRVQGVDPGFRADGVITLRTVLPGATPAPARREFYARVLGDARSLPGVASAAYISFLPMTFGAGNLVVTVPGVTTTEEIRAHTRFITPDYFKTMGIALRRGRDVTDGDDAIAQRVTVISQSLADRLWPGQDPLGREMRLAGIAWTVVGVVGDVAVRGLEQTSLPQAYFPAEQLPYIGSPYAPNDLVVRTSGDPAALAAALRRIVQTISPEQAISNVRVLQEIVDDQTASRRAQVAMLAAFASVAFLLAAIGIYGLLAFSVSVRTPEVGVRLALGATRRDVVGLFLRQGVLLGLAGIALGLPLAYAAAQAMTALLFGVHPADPAIYVAAAVLAMTMTLAGSVRPAVRAAGIDPAVTIRNE